MSEPVSLDSVLNQAREHEREYDWLDATESYRKALGLVPNQDLLRVGEIHERLGYALYRAGMQGESQEEFKERVHQSVTSYEKAKEFYAGLGEPARKPRMLRCEAMIAFMRYWLTADVPEKKRLIEECWGLTEETLNAFEAAGDALEYGRTYNQLSVSALFAFSLTWDFHVREKIMREAVEHGERAVKFLSAFKDPYELARAYAKTVVFLGAFGYHFLDIDEREECFQKCMDYWQKAKDSSEEIAMIELLCPVSGSYILFGLEGTDEALTNYRKALEYAKRTRDKFFIGCALDWLTYHTFWRINATEDPDERIRLGERSLQHAEDAKHQLSKISFISPRADLAWIEVPQAEYYNRLSDDETNLRKKHDLLEKAVEAAQHLMKRAEDSRYPEIKHYSHHVLGTVLLRLAIIETNSEEKRRLLEEALAHRNESIRLTEQFTPFMYWNQGVGLSGLARIKSGLADLAKDSETKKKLIQAAIMDFESAYKLAIKELAFLERKGSVSSLFAVLGLGQCQYGDLLIRLYEFICSKEHLRKAAQAYEDAAESFQKVNYVSRMAECYWKAAQVYDNLGEHLKAAESFDTASSYYKSAGEKIPQLRDFYQDHALYMRAWSEIQKARHHHRSQEYGLAREHFERATELHKSSKRWSYLASNYAAWAKLEHAEELSRNEQSEEALKTFEQATRLFEETKKSLQTQLAKIENLDEKQMSTAMVKATDQRHEYCTARIALEEAKILDKKGKHDTSSEKYGSAAETLEKVRQASESEQEQKEIGLIICLSRAWQKMTRAEAEASPTLFAEASQLFEEAKESSPNEQTKMLLLGHSRFCRALETGTMFADTRDVTLYGNAMQYLESAANYYVKAGFPKASEYAKATGLLFDAYQHMDSAKREKDPEKKARLYMMAEKVLQTSAGSYLKAEHPEKREQVMNLLEKVKEERELAVSLTEVLHAPSIVSTTSAFSAPTPTQEEAVGSERFEHADVQANIIDRRKELKVGENFDLEIELVNAGKGPALLTKIKEAIPESFDLVEKPEKYRVEDSYLNMKGKRLDPLKTEEVRLVLKPKVQGEFPLKPRILYIDENGKYRVHEPEPVNITVKELGIKGWLKGER